MDIIIQLIGIVAMTMNILSYQSKNAKGIIVMLLLGTTLFSTHFFLLGAIVGALMNAVSMLRSLFFVVCKHPPKQTMYLFIGAAVILYVLNFTLFGTEATVKNLLLNLLPIIGTTSLTVGFYSQDGNFIRKMGYISSPSWLIYNIFYFSLGGIICETISIISITLGLIRFGLKNKKQK